VARDDLEVLAAEYRRQPDLIVGVGWQRLQVAIQSKAKTRKRMWPGARRRLWGDG
jgi:hypothetical protein